MGLLFHEGFCEQSLKIWVRTFFHSWGWGLALMDDAWTRSGTRMGFVDDSLFGLGASFVPRNN